MNLDEYCGHIIVITCTMTYTESPSAGHSAVDEQVVEMRGHLTVLGAIRVLNDLPGDP